MTRRFKHPPEDWVECPRHITNTQGWCSICLRTQPGLSVRVSAFTDKWHADRGQYLGWVSKAEAVLFAITNGDDS